MCGRCCWLWAGASFRAINQRTYSYSLLWSPMDFQGSKCESSCRQSRCHIVFYAAASQVPSCHLGLTVLVKAVINLPRFKDRRNIPNLSIERVPKDYLANLKPPSSLDIGAPNEETEAQREVIHPGSNNWHFSLPNSAASRSMWIHWAHTLMLSNQTFTKLSFGEENSHFLLHYFPMAYNFT